MHCSPAHSHILVHSDDVCYNHVDDCLVLARDHQIVNMQCDCALRPILDVSLVEHADVVGIHREAEGLEGLAQVIILWFGTLHAPVQRLVQLHDH